MDISFLSGKLNKTFNCRHDLARRYGPEQARVIMLRMAVLRAATSLAEVPRLPPDRCHELKGDKQSQFAVDLKQPYRLVFKPNHQPIPHKQDGGIDLTQVTAITILSVEDYH